MGTGTCAEITAVFYELHTAEVDLTVAFDCIFDGVSGFCEGRRIEDDYVELFTFFLQFRKQVKYIGCDEFHAVGKSVQLCIFCCLCNTKLGSIDTEYFRCACNTCIQSKRTCVCEAVEDTFSFADLVDRKTVVFLVKEETGLLTVLNVNDIFDSVFYDLNFGVKWLANESFHTLHAFLETYFRIASFVNAADRDSVLSKNLF